MYKKRYLEAAIKKDLQRKKLIMLGGPRQVGKTTCAQSFDSYAKLAYYNWDNDDQRKAILAKEWPTETKIIVLDELHKYARWKNFIKGIYDVDKDKYNFLITGSARLDTYKKGGDSLLGRYHHYRLHPFSSAELLDRTPSVLPGEPLVFSAEKTSLNKLLQFGGFPEMFTTADQVELRRWHIQRKDKILKDDIRDLSLVRELSLLHIFADSLADRVGSLFSLNSLREDLELNYRTSAHWLSLLESLYYCYRVYPYNSKKIRSLKKEPKIYLWDWSELKNPAARLENLVAGHLLKFCHYYQDVLGYTVELNYLRDVDGRELDFLVTIDNKPWLAVEVKSSNTELSSETYYYRDRLNIPYVFQAVLETNKDYVKNGIRIMSLEKFLTGLV